MANLEIPANTSRATPATPAAAAITQIDLSGYKYDIVPTYKMIEDTDDQDSLFRIQFLQAFGIDTGEYHPEVVSAVIDDLYERYRVNLGIREILEAHPLYQAHTPANDDDRDDRNDGSGGGDGDDHHGNPANDNSEMIFCMMFSFQLFDLFHMCLRHAKNKEEIPATLRDEIVECFRTMF
jgi:hypothetical protein